jgi:8-amino-7-oxononanoate synthase
MIDFTSSLYLGLKHGSRDIAGWQQLTLGKPAALEAVPGSSEVEGELARISGCERAIVAPSTLHLFWDLFPILAKPGVTVFLDDGAYPIVRWGAERAAGLGVAVRQFRHYDIQALQRELRRAGSGSVVIAADGYCASCGKGAPLHELLDLLRDRSGSLLIDDTQALGIFGRGPRPWRPYGSGGGGSLQLAGISDPALLVVSSLAKGFGVPVAVLVGSEAMLTEYESTSKTRVHCSPPSVAVIAAATRALIINQEHGDCLRLRLAQRVAHFRGKLSKLGLFGSNNLFPVQPLRLPGHKRGRDIYTTLLQCGVRTVLQRGSHENRERITFVITAEHSETDIDYAAACLSFAMGLQS